MKDLYFKKIQLAICLAVLIGFYFIKLFQNEPKYEI